MTKTFSKNSLAIQRTKETYLAALRKKMEAIAAMKSRGLSAAVYTQTSDVEGEVNGLVTYDRRVMKVEPAMKEINRALTGAGAMSSGN